MVTVHRFSKIPNSVLIETTECNDLVEMITEEDELINPEYLIHMATKYSNQAGTSIRYWLRVFLVRKQKGYCYPWEENTNGRIRVI